MHTNLLEQRAVQEAWKAFLPVIQHVLRMSDNVTILYINKQEGTRSIPPVYRSDQFMELVCLDLHHPIGNVPLGHPEFTEQ